MEAAARLATYPHPQVFLLALGMPLTSSYAKKL
jgi:hypothetical protein